ncbi:MAG: DnaA N-terminal domain-containing protein, partial [Alphaproteobacteria bacterium]
MIRARCRRSRACRIAGREGFAGRSRLPTDRRRGRLCRASSRRGSMRIPGGAGRRPSERFFKAGESMLVAPTSELEQEWETVQDLLRDEVGETAYTTWLQPLAPAEVDGDRVVIGAP